jgi:histidinol dehydrogenase
VEYARKFDGVDLRPEEFAVSGAEFFNASLTADLGLRKALEAAAKNIEKFSRKSIRKGWCIKNAQGGWVGEKYDPFQRVGLYVPGGTAPLISTVLMTVVLAKVAGCPEIVVCTPPGKDGGVNPGLLLACRMAGATEVYKVGGAQAIAAMAFGTKTIKPVQKIFGPGNAYVVTAKRLIFGRVAIDLLPGPSEVLIIADETADARFVAADMLAQAEHGSGHERVWMVTPSKALLKQVERELRVQLPKLARKECIEKALRANGCLVLVQDLDQAVEVANLFAPEHCEIHTRKPDSLAARIFTAGAIFLGGMSPTVLGDYVSGPSHTLPTGGAGRSFAGLTVDQFQRRTSVVEYDRQSLRKSLGLIRTFAGVEGLSAHARSAEVRLAGKGLGKRS